MGNNFKPVEVIKSFLGIKKGTILKFDEYSSRYISRAREEEVGDNEYYYSGSAVELDPMIVEKNIDKFFKILELPVAKSNGIIELKPEVAESGCKNCDLLFNDGKCHCEEIPESTQEEVEFVPPTNELPKLGATLVFECGLCHHINNISYIHTGLFFPANEDTSLVMKCENCDMRTKLYYTVAEDETTEKSK